jgi:hypothetical protein
MDYEVTKIPAEPVVNDFENPKVNNDINSGNESHAIREKMNEPRLIGPKKVELDF